VAKGYLGGLDGTVDIDKNGDWTIQSDTIDINGRDELIVIIEPHASDNGDGGETLEVALNVSFSKTEEVWSRYHGTEGPAITSDEATETFARFLASVNMTEAEAGLLAGGQVNSEQLSIPIKGSFKRAKLLVRRTGTPTAVALKIYARSQGEDKRK
jgi:hypothetical protein